MAHPVSPLLAKHPRRAAEASHRVSRAAALIFCMEGPQFSSLAESLTYKAPGYSVIGLTNMPEAKLAREAEICYASVRDGHRFRPAGIRRMMPVTVQDIIQVLNSNAEKAKALVARLARDFPREHEAVPIRSDRALDYRADPRARGAIHLLAKLD